MSETTNIYGEDIHLTTVDAANIYNQIISSLEQGAGEPLYPGDERRIYGEAIVAVFVALYNTMDDVGRQTLLRYARGEVLDAIGERLNVKRLEGSKATTTMRFALSTPRDTNIIIPKWTKVTPNGEIYFATDDIAVLQAGTYSVDVPTSAVSNGEIYNGYAPGTITTLVDLIPYIETITNLTATSGGDDGELYTKVGDDRYRERIRLAPAKLSTAGPETAYIYWAMTADSSIIDVKAISEVELFEGELSVYDGKAFMAGPLNYQTLIVKADEESDPATIQTDYTINYTDNLLTISLLGSLASVDSIYITVDKTSEGCVKIIPLLEGGEIPDEDMLQKVLQKVNARNVRPLTDKVTAVAPKPISYDITLTYYTTPSTEAEVVENIEGSNGAIARYNQWQIGAIGRDINPDQLRRLILSPDWDDGLVGAVRVDLLSPTYTTVTDTEVAQFSGKLTVNHINVAGGI